jgi:single-stranded-DNA-specific exonuclease
MAGAGATTLASALGSSAKERAGETIVAQSVSGKRWRLRAADERLGLALAQTLGVPEIVGRLLAGRGIGLDEAPDYLNPTLRAALPDPSHLLDMDKAVERLCRAIRARESIAVFGDYDVDGATSSALLRRYLRACGLEPIIYIPDRMKEGYGPNGPAMLALSEQGARIVVTVDCGITAHEPLEIAANAGLDVIVVDHHVAEPKLPRAFAVINPNRLDETSPHGNLAAVGVTYLLVVALNRALRDSGFWGQDRPAPDLMHYLDIVALGTVCDIAKLTGVNRAFVAQGLKVMARRGNVGLVALGDVAKMENKPEAWHCGFFLGPRVNAGGRVGVADLGMRLLTTDDALEAQAIAQRLDALNIERREIEAHVLEEACAQVAAVGNGSGPTSLAFAVGRGWHPGVIGIVASRLKEQFNVPACVLALDEHGVAKGSARSVRGVDFGAAVIAARQAGLLINGGGHPMAAGFAVAEDNIPALRDFLSLRIAQEISEGDIGPALSLDGALTPKAVNLQLAETIQQLGPFGAGNPEPRFWLPSVRLMKPEVLAGKHVRVFVTGDATGGGGRLKAVAFRAVDTPLGEAMLNSGGRAVSLAGRLRLNEWMGSVTCEFQVDDIAVA